MVVCAFWFVGVFAYFVIFLLFLTSNEKVKKPIRADVRTTPLSMSNKESVDLFAPPEEDIVYVGIRRANQVFTCGYSRNSPLQAIIVNIWIFCSLLVLCTAIAIQVSVQISRDIATKTVIDLALKSQVDSNLICVDERFRKIFDNNLHAKPSAFLYKTDPSDFLRFSAILAEESITDCSSLVVYQSNYSLVPEQFSESKKRI